MLKKNINYDDFEDNTLLWKIIPKKNSKLIHLKIDFCQDFPKRMSVITS